MPLPAFGSPRLPSFTMPLAVCVTGILAMLGGFPSIAAGAETGRFRVTAPDGGTVHVVTVDPADPSNLYAGTLHAGVFRSNNGGESWQPAGDGLRGPWVSALAVAPSDPRVLYASLAGAESGVFRSGDRGESWSSIGGDTVPGAWGLAVHPGSPETLLVANGNRLWQTSDAGASWADITPDAPPDVFLTFRVAVFDPVQPSTLYVGSNGGILRSTDSGVTWTRKQPDAFVLALTLDPLHPRTLWAGREGGVLKTVDGGDSWHFLPLPIDPYDVVTALAVDPADPRILYAAAGPSTIDETIFRSEDGGSSWEPLLITGGVFSLAVDPAHPTTVWAGGRGFGVLRSTDGGLTWGPARQGLKASAVTALAADPTRPGTLVAGVEDGAAPLVRTEDGGETWTPVEVDLGFPAAAFRTEVLVPDTARPGLLYGVFSGILRRSGNFGKTWEALPGHPPLPVVSLAVTDDPDRLVASARETVPCDLGLGCESFQYLHLFHTADGGATWEEALPPGEAFLGHGLLTSAPSDPAVVYYVRGDVFASLDAGNTWRRVNRFSVPTFFALEVDPRDPRLLYAGTRLGAGGVLRSLDGGETWHFRGTGLPGGQFAGLLIRDLLIDPVQPQRLYLASDAGVFASQDGGASWQPFSDGFDGLPVQVLALDPTGAGKLYAGGPSGGGLFVHDRTPEPCVDGPTQLCLQGGRFRATVTWRDFQGGSGAGRAVPLRNDSGAFWFFAEDNIELMVKVLDGRAVNGHFWVFLGALTNVAFEVTVTDTATGEVWRHSNPSRHFASLGDVTAF